MLTLTVASCKPYGGVFRYRFDGKSLLLYEKCHCPEPMFFSLEKDAIKVLLRNPFAGNNESGLVKIKLLSDGSMKLENEIISTKGIVACHLCTWNNRTYVTNYLSGSIFCDDMRVVQHTGKGLHPDRQEAPHTHFVYPSPDGNLLLCTDLGLDTIFVYDKKLNEVSRAKVPDGHGCRHLAYSEDGKYIFCCNELESTVSVFRYNKGLTLLNTVSAIKGNKEDSYCAAIRVFGSHIYVSNRGDDSISCFRFEDEQLKLVSVTNCGGRYPRDFCICGEYLFCANQMSNSITVLKIAGDELKKTGICEKIDAPLCIMAEY